MADRAEYGNEGERAARRLREQILDGVRAPGSRLVERDLADELGVSRVPVRAALQTLAAEGLVELRPRSWAVVREFTDADVADLDEVRAAIEPLAFRLLTERAGPTEIARLRAVVDAGIAAAERGDAVLARRSAADFHEVAIELAGNRLLAEFGRLIGSRLRWNMGQHDEVGDMAADHDRILAAIEARDAALVADLIAAHQRVSRTRLNARRSVD